VVPDRPALLPTVEGPLARLRRFCESPRRVIPLILGLSLLLRIGLFVELSSGPCLELHRWEGGDMYLYDAWARRIAAGDWLSRDVERPVPREVVQEYLSTHPAEAASLAGAADPEATLWKRWTGAPGFYTDPLYPYLVALTYLVAGPDPRHVFVWQLALGVAISVLVYLVTRRSFGDAAGAVAGVLASLYSPLLYYEVLLLREAPIAFLAIALVFLTLKAIDTGGPAWWSALGVTSGLSFLLKSTFLLQIAGLWGGALLVALHRRTLGRTLAPLLAGFAFAVSPLVARNLAVGAPPLAAAANGAVTFISGNAGDYDAAKSGFVRSRYTAEILAASGGRLLPAVVATLRTHASPRSWLRQLWAKVDVTLNWFEVPNNASFYFFRLHSAVLRWLPVTFFLVGPLGLLGLALSVRRWREGWPAWIAVGAAFAPLVVFLTLSRLRLPMAVALIPFAAFAVARIGGWALGRTPGERRLATLAATCLLMLTAWTGRGHAGEEARLRLDDYIVALQVHVLPVLAEANQRRDFERAVDALWDAVRTEPETIARLDRDHPALGAWEVAAANHFANVRDAYAEALEITGHSDEAETQRRRATALRGSIR
jgi:hypothetical protein